MLGHDPWKRYRLHPDHRHAGCSACDGIVAARDPHFFPEHGIAHHRPGTLLLFEADEPDHVEDVDGLRSTPSSPPSSPTAASSRSTMHAVDDSQLGAFEQRLRDRLAELGEPHGFGAAEVFHRIDDL